MADTPKRPTPIPEAIQSRTRERVTEFVISREPKVATVDKVNVRNGVLAAMKAMRVERNGVEHTDRSVVIELVEAGSVPLMSKGLEPDDEMLGLVYDIVVDELSPF